MTSVSCIKVKVPLTSMSKVTIVIKNLCSKSVLQLYLISRSRPKSRSHSIRFIFQCHILNCSDKSTCITGNHYSQDSDHPGGSTAGVNIYTWDICVTDLQARSYLKFGRVHTRKYTHSLKQVQVTDIYLKTYNIKIMYT